jgi:hypothetical protein
VILDGHMIAVHGYEFDSYVGEKWEESGFWARALMLYERLFKTWIRMPLQDNYTWSNRFVHWGFYWLVRWTRLLRWLGPRIRRPELGGGLLSQVDFWTRGVLGDPMGITMPAFAAIKADARFDTIVCGHSHLPGVVELPGGKRYVNLGSWSFGNSQYGVWDGRRFELRDWISGREIGDENYRPIIEGRADRRYEDWFRDEYLGWWRYRCGEEALRQGVRPRPWVLGRPATGLGMPPPPEHVALIDTHADDLAPVQRD